VIEALASVLRGLPAFRPGSVWLAGAGPGEPGHLTLHAVAALGQADVVVHDALVRAEVLALARPGAERVFAGKRGGRASCAQADITARLIALARAGRRVLRLKGGDPFVFGRGAEEALALAEAGIPFRIIPGLTAGLAGLALAGIPATLRGVNQAVVLATGHAAGEGAEGLDWAALARLGQPIVLYMAMRRIGAIADTLLQAGLPGETPAAVVSAAATPGERVLDAPLGGIAAAVARLDPAQPAVIVIGGVAALRLRLAAAMAEASCSRAA